MPAEHAPQAHAMPQAIVGAPGQHGTGQARNPDDGQDHREQVTGKVRRSGGPVAGVGVLL